MTQLLCCDWLCGRVDPGRLGQCGGLRQLAHEALGMRGVGDGKRLLSRCPDGRALPAMDLPRRQQANAAVMMLLVVPAYQRKNGPQNTRAPSTVGKRSGKSGWYFSVLKPLSEYGLSLET